MTGEVLLEPQLVGKVIFRKEMNALLFLDHLLDITLFDDNDGLEVYERQDM